MISLQGKTALVTGATGGLGSEIVGRLKEEGCDIICVGSNRSSFDKKVHGFPVYHCDFMDRASTCRLGLDADERKIDVLVNCAGVFPQSDLAESGDGQFDECFDVNVRAPFLLMRALMPGMAARGWGRVLNICSTSAHAGFSGSAVYCASKHALLGLSRALDEEYKARNVRVLSLSPGSMKTEMGRQVHGQDYDTLLEPGDVAETAILMLRSEGLNEVVMRRRTVQ